MVEGEAQADARKLQIHPSPPLNYLFNPWEQAM